MSAQAIQNNRHIDVVPLCSALESKNSRMRGFVCSKSYAISFADQAGLSNYKELDGNTATVHGNFKNSALHRFSEDE